MYAFLCRVLVLLLAFATVAEAQVYVAPRRPGKSVVRYFDHDWRQLDLLVGEQVEGKEAPGLRLYFYEQEREPAEKAAALIEAAYRKLAHDFGHVPQRRFAFVLYGSYQEFLRTNLFPLQEGVLGVTSTETLATTLPWFGDAERFAEVCTHELAHEFTIQKTRELTKGRSDPMQRLPLWFVEGLAEYYAKGGVDAETRMLLTDLAANPRLEGGYGLADFWLDAPGSVLWTYKIGLARVTFLEETYGAGTLQRLLEGTSGFSTSLSAARMDKDFKGLVQRITKDDPDRVADRFEAWVKDPSFRTWLEARTKPADMDPLGDLRWSPDTLDASPDGDTILFRTMDPHSGRVRLYLVDPRAPQLAKRVVEDNRPGVESLHPVEARNFDLGGRRLAFVAESNGHDVIYWQDWSRKARKARVVPEGQPPVGLEADRMAVAAPEERPEDLARPWVIRWKLGKRRELRLVDEGLVAAFTPALSPDERELAFVGLDQAGFRDLFVLDLETRKLRRLTEDPYAERGVAWGPTGIVYTSDATEHRRFNVFRVAPSGGTPERLASEPRDHLDPAVLADGRVVFSAYEDGRADLYTVTPEGVVPLTAVDTSLRDAASGPKGGVWALHHDEGESRPVRIPRDQLVAGAPRATLPPGTPAPMPERDLGDAVPYRAAAPENWQLEDIFGLIGAGSGVIVGQVLLSASDQLREHVIVLDAATYGEIALTDGYLAFIDQSGRTTWGGGPFHFLRFHVDRSLGEDLLFQSGERFYGGMLSWRFPFDRYVHVQIDEALGASRWFVFEDTAAGLDAYGLYDDWTAINGGAPLQSETTVRLGLDTVRYHAATGPLAGHSAMLAGTWGVRPLTAEMYGTVRLDAEKYFPLPLFEGANIGFRGAAGSGMGGRLAPSFWLSSYDTLRGVPYGDTDFLLGQHFWFGRSELELPINAILQVQFLSNVEAVAGLDFGGVADDPAALWDSRVLDVALGGNFILGPLVLRVHFAHPLDVGAPVPETAAPWVPNVSLGWISW